MCLSIFIFSVPVMSSVSVMVPYTCPVFNMWLAYADLLLFFSDCLCMFFVSSVEYSAYLLYVF
jgi:hypothetical protein